MANEYNLRRINVAVVCKTFNEAEKLIKELDEKTKSQEEEQYG